ncbi:hypothetical protein ACHAW5_008932 [Stephanodiscus triporus]|uniref:START domain-containing protein n=1 Tax=Stephanodiscus triporus TaxID=2934178 RepID=A0ABD3MYX4_9STRA
MSIANQSGGVDCDPPLRSNRLGELIKVRNRLGMISKIVDVDPFLVALFDLPVGVQASTKNDRRNDGRGDSRRRPNQPDSADTDNASLLHGESIPLTDEEYSGAASRFTPLESSSFNAFLPRPRLPVIRSSDKFIASGGDKISPFGFGTESNTLETKKKRKMRSAAIKSLKKLVGRGSKDSSNNLPLPQSFDEADSVVSYAISGPPSLVESEKSLNTPANNIDDLLSLDRLSTLKSKIGRIRSIIHSLEGDLVATRNELAKAHQHLHFATMELADIQRATLEADVGLSMLVHRNGEMSSSRMSPLYFFDADMTGRSSTPRSTSSSSDSFLSFNENDSLDSPTSFEASARTLKKDEDTTPLKRNSKVKHSFRRIDSRLDSSFESDSIDNPSAASLTQEEINTDQGKEQSLSGFRENSLKESHDDHCRRVTFCSQESFIRAHDLAINGSDNSPLVSLHKSGIRDIVNALFEKGAEYAMDESDRWTPEQGTGKLLNKRSNGDIVGPMGKWPNGAYGDEVLVWSSKCSHSGFGSEYPMVKARGLIPTSALQMVQLLLDSGRVKQYNKMSLGRIDEHCFAKGVDRLSECPATGVQGEVKIVRSKSQPPMIRKPVELRLLLHARRLLSQGGDGSIYLTIGRSVWETEVGTTDAEDNSVTRCEMLLSVNMIRDLPVSNEQWCEITTITHGVSPGIPISIGKRVGLAAAAKYIRDIRAVFEN